MLHEVLIDPGHGHSNDAGAYCLGHVVPGLTELDCIDLYTRRLVETLEERNVRVRVLKTRKSPGLRPKERALESAFDQIVISCHMGFSASPGAYNHGAVYVPDAPSPLAYLVRDVMTVWGGSTAPSFKVADISQARFPIMEIAKEAIHLEPFELNGPDATVLAGRLPRLGEMLGMALAGYFQIAERQLQRPLTTAPEKSLRR